MNKLPVYEMVIDQNPESEVEVSFVALVDKPAIEKNFLAFKSEQLNFLADPDKQIISGPAMVADTLIYRRDQNGEYNVFFSADTIKQIALKFFKKDYHKNLNLFHDPNLSIQGVTIFNSFVSDKSMGIQPMEQFKDLPDGTWFISAKVDNSEVWARIKSGEVKGFSVEGIFSYIKKAKTAKHELTEELNRTLPDDCHLQESSIMAFKDMLATFKQKFLGESPAAIAPAPVAPAPTNPATPQTLAKDYTLKDGTTTVNISDLTVGGVVMIAGAPAPPGEYELQDGTKCTVGEGGVITALVPAAVPEMAMTEVKVNELISKALQQHQAAIELANRTKLEADQKLISEQKLSIQKQDEKIKGLFELVEELAKTPTANPVGDDQKLTFAQEQVKTREEKLRLLNANIQKLKKVS